MDMKEIGVMEIMPDYKQMYTILRGAISDALDVLPERPDNQKTRQILEAALKQVGEIYIGRR